MLICHLQVEGINSLVSELVNITAKEKVLLEYCKDFSSTLAAMQVNDLSVYCCSKTCPAAHHSEQSSNF